jgi:ankyrin repeat protein
MLHPMVILILFNILFQKEIILKQQTNIFSLNHIYGFTSLNWASSEGHLDIVQYLISKGANIEAKDNNILSQSYLWKYFINPCFLQW